NAHIMAGQRLTAGNDLQWPWIIRPCGFRDAAPGQRSAIDAVDERGSRGRREGEPDRVLREAVGGGHRVRPEPVTLKSCREAAEGLYADRLSAICNHAQRTQVEA